jgi:hypothetical protein
MGGPGGVKKLKLCGEVTIKGRVELDHPLVLENFAEYESPAFYDCPRPN